MSRRAWGAWAISLIVMLCPAARAAQERANAQEPGEPALDPRPFQQISAKPTPGAPTVGLSRAVALALEGNFGLRAAADSEASARFRESAARAQFYPKLTPRYQRASDESSLLLDASQKLPFSGASITASGALRTFSTEIGPLPRTSDFRLTLTQPLLRGFGPTATSFDVVNSRRARELQERSYELARQRLAVDVTAAYYQVAKQRQLVEVARQSLRRSEGLRESSEARIKVGLASRLDVLRAELQASQAEDAMVSAQAALETALEQFRVLLGLSPTDALEPEEVTFPERLDLTVEPFEALVARAIEKRLELRETRDQVEDSRRSFVIARQALLPQLDLNLGFTQFGFGSTLSDSLRRTDRRWSLFLTTSYPLERASDRATRAVAELDLAARKRTLRQRELEVEAEVRSAVRNLERIRKSVELQRKGVDFAEQQHRLATMRYQRGLASNFDVVDAEGSLVAARTALVGLLTDFQVARMQLLRVTGSLDVAREFAP